MWIWVRNTQGSKKTKYKGLAQNPPVPVQPEPGSHVGAEHRLGGRELWEGIGEEEPQEGSLSLSYGKQTVGIHWWNEEDHVRGFCRNLLRDAGSCTRVVLSIFCN